MVFRPLARSEYQHSKEWYATQRAGLGLEFEAEVETVLLAIAEHPERYPVADDNIREAFVARFPFCVYFRVRPDRIVVVAVYHQLRDPSGWQTRA